VKLAEARVFGKKIPPICKIFVFEERVFGQKFPLLCAFLFARELRLLKSEDEEYVYKVLQAWGIEIVHAVHEA
jgi:hypothetical protein